MCMNSSRSGLPNLTKLCDEEFSPSLHGLSPAASLLRDKPTSLPTSHRGRCLPSALPFRQGSAEIHWGKAMHFPAALPSLPTGRPGISGAGSLAHWPIPPALRGFTGVQNSVSSPGFLPTRPRGLCSCLRLVVASRCPHKGLSPLAHHHAQRTRPRYGSLRLASAQPAPQMEQSCEAVVSETGKSSFLSKPNLGNNLE